MLNITFQGTPLTVSGEQLKVGDKAPIFTAVTRDLNKWSLDSISGVKIISVVPSLDTAICQIQTKHFDKDVASIGGVDLVTISLDLPFAQDRWSTSADINNTIFVSDYQDRDFAKKYSLLIDQLKLLSRSVLVLDKDNIVKYVEYVPEVVNEPDYAAAINVAKLLVLI